MQTMVLEQERVIRGALEIMEMRYGVIQVHGLPQTQITIVVRTGLIPDPHLPTIVQVIRDPKPLLLLPIIGVHHPVQITAKVHRFIQDHLLQGVEALIQDLQQPIAEVLIQDLQQRIPEVPIPDHHRQGQADQVVHTVLLLLHDQAVPTVDHLLPDQAVVIAGLQAVVLQEVVSPPVQVDRLLHPHLRQEDPQAVLRVVLPDHQVVEDSRAS